MDTVFSFRGGVRIGENLRAFNATWPFATLRASDSELKITYFFAQKTFPKASILKLSQYKGVFFTGLQIQHEIPLCPSMIVFWTFQYNDLRAKLIELGYAF